MQSQNESQFTFTTGVVGYPVAFVLLLWFVFWVEIRFGYNFTVHGIYPRTFSGLQGVIFSPFIHSEIVHLYHNTIPVFVLTVALFYFYRPLAWRVLIFGGVLAGLLTWLIARPSYHIGASGIVYLLASFIFFKGIFAKHLRLIALSLIIVFLYGSLLWYIFPIKEGISWEGHLSGFSIGFILSLLYRKQIAPQPRYDWEEPTYNEEEDAFLKHFDADGNFIESLDENPDLTQEAIINYRYKSSDKKEH